METVSTGVIEWAVAELVLPGQTESGDRCLVTAPSEGGLVAVVAGLGHGAEAAGAAKAAVSSLERHAQEPIIQLIRSCHRSLAGTRGVVMSVAVFDAHAETMTWVGVGNVEGVLLRAQAAASPRREMLLLRRSEEHTSELQSLAYLVCRLLLEKKKKKTTQRAAPPEITRLMLTSAWR